MDEQKGVVVGENPPEIGADAAIDCVPVSHRGPCAVIGSPGERVIAVLPNKAVAVAVARYAITPDGGYGSVEIQPASGPVTHATFEEWVFR